MKPSDDGMCVWQIDAALARLDDGEYGYCVTCGEEINADRLALDPSVALCLRHAR